MDRDGHHSLSDHSREGHSPLTRELDCQGQRRDISDPARSLVLSRCARGKGGLPCAR